MRGLRLYALLTTVIVIVLGLYYCKDYTFAPLTEIAVMPGTVSFPLKQKGNNPSDSFKEVQHFYIENRSASAPVRLYEMWFWDKNRNDYMIPVYKGVPLVDDKQTFMGYYIDPGDVDGDHYTNQHLFKLEFDFDLRYLVTDNQNDKLLNVNRQVIDYPDRAVVVKAKCDSDPTNGCDIYSLRRIRQTKNTSPLTLYALNYCDQLVLRTYLKQKLLNNNRSDFVQLAPRREATYRQLASEEEAGDAKVEAPTMNDWRKELELASCPQEDCRFDEFYESMIQLNHPDIYGVQLNQLLDDTGQPDWEKISQVCLNDDGTFKADMLSIDIVSNGNIDENKIRNKFKVDMLKVIVRYIREPQVRIAEGWRSARDVLLCNSSNEEVNSMLCEAHYDQIAPLANIFQARIAHSARVDVSGSAEEAQVSGFLAMVNINLEGKASGFPVPAFGGQGVEQDPSDPCTWYTYKEPLDKVYIDGSASYSPGGYEPLSYYWVLAERPPNAVDAILIEPTASTENPVDISQKYVEFPNPKIYLPLAGTYKIKLKVRDSRGVESDDPANTATCQWATLIINVVPSNKVYVQLAWDKGEQTDMDLFLVRKRDACGTMGYSIPFQDKISVPAASFPTSCSSNADCCPSGYSGCTGLDCIGGSCQTSCSDDAYCQRAHPGYTCEAGQCSDNGGTWRCNYAQDQSVVQEPIDQKDADCNNEGYCVPQELSNAQSNWICTNHSYQALNDSCGWNNRNPDWGVIFDPTDDPQLDIDDVDGYGPETISIPQPPEGVYRAVVRLYADPNGIVSENDPLHAYITIYINGEKCDLGDALTMAFTKTLTYWKVVDINWHGDNTTCDDVSIVPLNPPDANTNPSGQCLTGDASCAHANPFWAVTAAPFDPCDEILPRSIWCDTGNEPECCYENGGSCGCCGN